MESQYLHKAELDEQGNFSFDNINMWNLAKDKLKNCRVGITIELLDEEKCNQGQRGLYFGVIIKQFIMNHEWFRGKNEHEVHEELMLVLRSFPQTIRNIKTKKEITVTAVENLSDYGKRKMAQYINDVLDFMVIELDMSKQVEEIENFKLNKYEIRRDKDRPEN